MSNLTELDMISAPSYIKIYSTKQILIDKAEGNPMTEVTLVESYFDQLGLLESF